MVDDVVEPSKQRETDIFSFVGVLSEMCRES